MVMTEIPLQQNADPDNPRTALGWAMVGLPFQGQAVPMVVQPSQYEEWSQQLWNIGLRHHPELQTVHYQPPAADGNWMTSSAGEWISIEQDFSPESTTPDMSHLTLEEKRVLFERLSEEFATEPLNTNNAEVIR